MGKTLLMLFFLLLHGYFCIAQDDDGEKEGDDIKAVRMAYMTDQLKLSSDEAQRFWPVYNNYIQELRQARRDNSGDVVKQQEAIVNVKKKYKDNFRKVVGSDDRVNRVYKAQDDFRIMLRNEWQKRHPNANNNNRQQLQQLRQQHKKN